MFAKGKSCRISSDMKNVQVILWVFFFLRGSGNDFWWEQGSRGTCQWKCCQSLCRRHIVAAAWKAELIKQPESCSWGGWRPQISLCSALIPHPDSTICHHNPALPTKALLPNCMQGSEEDQESSSPILPRHCCSPWRGEIRNSPSLQAVGSWSCTCPSCQQQGNKEEKDAVLGRARVAQSVFFG